MEGEESPVLAAPGEGSYSVWVTDFVDCPAVESPPVVYVGLERQPQLGLVLYPNPFEVGFRLTVGEEWLGGQAELLDLTGRMMDCRPLPSKTTEWDGRLLPAGQYLLRLTAPDGGMGVTRKLVKR